MTLHEYLKANRIKVQAFCDLIGEKPNTINKIIYRQRQPSIGLANKINEATGGAVSHAELALPSTASEAA